MSHLEKERRIRRRENKKTDLSGGSKLVNNCEEKEKVKIAHIGKIRPNYW